VRADLDLTGNPQAGQPAGARYFRVLGPLAVEIAGTELRLGPQQRVLLAALLLGRGRIVPKQQLADALWTYPVPRGAPVTLRTHVLHLRRLLEPDRQPPSGYQVLVSGGARHDGGYCLRLDDDELDLAQFTQLLDGSRRLSADGSLDAALKCLDEALELWRGPAFADLVDREFVAAEARRLDELRLAAEEERIELLLALGRHRDAVSPLTLLIGENRLSEALWAQFMLALHRCGRRADALAAYRDVYALLRDELGVEPGPRLQQLHQQVLAADPALELGQNLALSTR